jgi:hypothetical protein
MPSPLNPLLYSRLKEEFGRVQVSHAGIAASTRYDTDPFTNKLKLKLTSAGEYYRINCPYCHDSRGRLWINHLWGVPDEVTGRKNIGLAICYNESCLEYHNRPMELYDRVYGFKNVGARGREPIVILQGEVEEQTLREVPLPGVTLRMDRMPETDKAVQYLRSRGFDPQDLGKTFEIGYCLDASGNYPMAQGRIVVPVIMRGVTVGWQCRYVGDIDWKAAGVPKYYNLPNMPRRLMLYNFDKAREYPYVVVTEGALDVWSVGESAVAAFGKHLSVPQMQLICENWESGAVVILLDGDAWETTIELAERFRQEQFKGAVVPVRLPPDKDPGGLTRAYLWECIDDECQRVGVDLLAMKKETHDDVRKSGLPHRAYRANRASGRDMGPQRPVPEYQFDVPRDAAAGAGLHPEGDGPGGRSSAP